MLVLAQLKGGIFIPGLLRAFMGEKSRWEFILTQRTECCIDFIVQASKKPHQTLGTVAEFNFIEF